MPEVKPQDKSLSDLVHFFSEATHDRAMAGEALLFDRSFPLPWRLALWLDYFLMAGGERIKEKWSELPLEEQLDLGLEVLKCYLAQPLFIRLSPERREAMKNQPLVSEKEGRLLRVIFPSESTAPPYALYPLAHERLWPGLLDVLMDKLFPSEELSKSLQPALVMAASSRLETIRKRAEVLSSFFFKGKAESLSSGSQPGQQMNPEEHALPPMAQIPAQAAEMLPMAIPEESDLPIPKDAEQPSSAASSRKKKKKTSGDQLKLFS